MNLVLQHIEYLISRHDCVVVPGLGAFLANSCSAEYLADESMFIAPSRHFTFNGELNVSDGLLVMSVARALSTDYDSASVKVSHAVEAIKEELINTGECTIGRLGRLERDTHGNISFVGYPTDYISPLSGWIGALRVEEISRQTKKLNSTPYHGRSGYDRPRHSRVVRHFRSAVGAAAAILIALIVSTPVAVKNTYHASTTPNITAPKAIEIPSPVVDVNENQSVSVDEIASAEETKVIEPTVIEQPGKQVLTVEKSVDATKSKIKQSTDSDNSSVKGLFRFDADDPYILVVASLATQEGAEKFVAQHSGMTDIQFGITHSGKYYRVYIATGSSGKEVMRQYANSAVSGRFDGVWPTRR